MSYRDDRDADQARIDALELELARARDRIAELEGKQSESLALVVAGSRDLAIGGPKTPAIRWFGARLKLDLVRRFDRPLSNEHFEDLVERIRAMTGDPGRTDLLRASLTWRSSTPEHSAGPKIMITVVVRDGATTLTVNDRLGQLAGAFFGGIGGGVGGGGITAPILASVAVPVLAPVFIAGWLGGVYFMVRKLYKRAASRRAETVQRLFDALVDDITEKLPP
jgi:hypothetical protein